MMLVVAGLSSCRKEPAKPAPAPNASLPAAPSMEVPKGFDKWNPKVQAYWLDMSTASRAYWLEAEKRQPFKDARDARERLELVSPPPVGFKPENAKRRLKLTLIPKATTIKAGEPFWFALEIQNVGREPVYFYEPDSYLKLGDSFASRTWQFLLTKPDGKTVKLKSRYVPGGISLPDLRRWKNGGTRISEEQAKKLLSSSGGGGWDGSDLRVTLQPGEILRSRAWKYIPTMEAYARRERGEDPHAHFPGRWRQLFVNCDFDLPGKYKLKVAYDDPPPQFPTEDKIQHDIQRGYSRDLQMRMYRTDLATHVGRIVSKTVSFEVVP